MSHRTSNLLWMNQEKYPSYLRWTSFFIQSRPVMPTVTSRMLGLEPVEGDDSLRSWRQGS